MSIATAIQNAQQKVAAAYTAVSSKGGTLPQTQDLSNLPTAINSISGGSFIGIPREVSEQGVYQFPSQKFTFNLPDGVTDLADRVLEDAFIDDPNIQVANLTVPNITGNYCVDEAFKNSGIETLTCSATEITGAGAFYGCCTDTSSLTSVSFPNLTKVGIYNQQSVFYQAFRATGLKKIEFPELVYLYGRTSFNYLCYNCKSLEEARFPKLKQISQVSEFQVMQSAFSGCDKLTTVDFSSLEYIKGASDLGYCFSGCTSLSTLSFPSFKATGSRIDAFSSMLNGVTGCTVHFPSNQQSTMGSWSDVTAGFGGTNTTVLFDLPATE